MKVQDLCFVPIYMIQNVVNHGPPDLTVYPSCRGCGWKGPHPTEKARTREWYIEDNLEITCF